MSHDVSVIKADSNQFEDIPPSVRLALLLPTARWTPMARAIIGSMVGVANEEAVVLISDNSENIEKRDFLRKIRNINPYVIAVAQEANIGAQRNFDYLYTWCSNIEFSAQMADDDWVSPTYHWNAYRALLDNPTVSCAEAGTTLVDIGDGKLVNVSQPSMCGQTSLERMQKWNCMAARATMYNASRREALAPALQFLRDTPLPGLTLGEDLWELSRLAHGDFLSTPGPDCLIHYPAHGSISGNATQRFYEVHCKGVGLQPPFVFFLSLSTAIQCALFLLGRLSPIRDPEQRALCAQHVFSHIFTTSFLPRVTSESSQAAATMLFANSRPAMEGFNKYCAPPFALNPTLDRSLISWFIDVVKVFEPPAAEDGALLSTRFRAFADTILDHQPGLPANG